MLIDDDDESVLLLLLLRGCAALTLLWVDGVMGIGSDHCDAAAIVGVVEWTTTTTQSRAEQSEAERQKIK